MNIEAMKLWLKALETSWYHVGTFCPTDAAIELYDEARDSLRQAIEQAQKQEPVACVTYKEVTDTMNKLWAGTLEQVQIAEEIKNKKLYTAPPQRQPLTDEQIEDLYFDRFSMGELKAFARAIEAAHGIKGEA